MAYQSFCNRTIKSVSLGLLAATVASSAVRAQSSPSPTPIANGTALDTLVRHHPGGDYVLTDPIYLNETNDGQWTPIGNSSRPFNGTLDGDGHIIYGLNLTTTDDQTPTGLFGKIQGSWVRRLVLVRPFIQSFGRESHTGSVAGVAERSNITDCASLSGVVRSDGEWARTGGMNGYADYSTVSGNLNTGTVRSYQHGAYTGGMNGEARYSTISGNLNTGTVRSKGNHAHIGGTNGYAHHSSTVSGNLNTGTVRSDGEWAAPGGTNGYAYYYSTVSGNLNTGKVSSKRISARSGGMNGEADWYSTVSGNLNTGTVSSDGAWAYTGGTNGATFSYSSVRDNLNTGTVSSKGNNAHTGGTNGYARYSTVSSNLNTGTVSSEGGSAYTGGMSGSAYRFSTVSGNLNTGAVSANGTNAWVGPAVGSIDSPYVRDNLNTGIFTNPFSLFETRGVLNLNETQIQSGNNGLNNATWHNGKDTQYPMLRDINAAYQDLRRINGTRNGNHTNTFPTVLDEFANPGGSKNDSLFDRTVWNIWGGYLPFLKHISREVAEQAGVDCGPGGFACGSCPVPMGVPDFQLFDPGTGRFYVVAHQSQTNQLLLVRYTADGSLDKAFGGCGVQAWLAPESPTIQAGVIHQGNFYLALADALLVLPLAGGAYRLVPAPEGVGLHSLVVQDDVLYYGGQRHGHFLVGKVSLPLVSTLTRLPDTLAASGAGTADILMMAGKRLYAAGQGQNHGLAYQYQYRSSLMSVPFASGRDKIDTVLDGFPNQTRSRVRALAVHNGWLYLVGNLDSPGRSEDLFICRYRLENGEADEDFVVSLSTGVDGQVPALNHEVHVRISNNGLTVFRHSTDDDQVFIGSWNWQGRAVSDNGLHRFPGMVQLARGLGLGSGQIYLAGADGSGFLMVAQSAWTLPDSPSPSPSLRGFQETSDSLIMTQYQETSDSLIMTQFQETSDSLITTQFQETASTLTAATASPMLLSSPAPLPSFTTVGSAGNQQSGWEWPTLPAVGGLSGKLATAIVVIVVVVACGCVAQVTVCAVGCAAMR